MSRPQLSIVIPAYRSERTIAACLEAFTTQSTPAEIVVVDSDPDGRSAAIAAAVPGVQALAWESRLLPHGARNIGARAASGDLLLFSDPDIYPEPGALAALVSSWGEHGGALVASLACHGRGYVERGAHLVKFDLWLAGSEPRTLDVGPTAGFLCTREAWEAVGGFRDDLMLGDTLFSWALRDEGLELRLEPRAVFRHDHTPTWRGLLRERYARGREFAGLRHRGGRTPGATVWDLVATVTLIRPARVVWRSAHNAWRAGLRRDAVLTLPVVAGGHLAWFAGELAGTLGASRGSLR
jgi:glycosyltransferase involved in cell wall biosynthesis